MRRCQLDDGCNGASLPAQGRRTPMRVTITFRFAVDPGNDLIKSGKIGQIFGNLIEDLKPEAAYFFPENGQRGGLMVINMDDSSQLAQVSASGSG